MKKCTSRPQAHRYLPSDMAGHLLARIRRAQNARNARSRPRNLLPVQGDRRTRVRTGLRFFTFSTSRLNLLLKRHVLFSSNESSKHSSWPFASAALFFSSPIPWLHDPQVGRLLLSRVCPPPRSFCLCHGWHSLPTSCPSGRLTGSEYHSPTSQCSDLLHGASPRHRPRPRRAIVLCVLGETRRQRRYRPGHAARRQRTRRPRRRAVKHGRRRHEECGRLPAVGRLLHDRRCRLRGRGTARLVPHDTRLPGINHTGGPDACTGRRVGPQDGGRAASAAAVGHCGCSRTHRPGRRRRVAKTHGEWPGQGTEQEY